MTRFYFLDGARVVLEILG